MRKKISRVAALIAFVGIVSLCVPGAYAAETKASKFDFKVLIKKPAAFFSSLLSFLPIFDNGKTIAPNDSQNSTGKQIKITGGLLSGRPSDGD